MKAVFEPGYLRSDAWCISIRPKFRISGNWRQTNISSIKPESNLRRFDQTIFSPESRFDPT